MKSTRQRAILSLVATRPIRSQEELARLLAQDGYDATQATISRDIRELGLVKVPLRDGDGSHFKYVERRDGPAYANRLHRVVAELVRSVAGSLNLVVLLTPPGSAMLVASAIDEAAWNEVLGTVGGDDTVLVVLTSANDLPVVQQRFLDLRAQPGAA